MDAAAVTYRTKTASEEDVYSHLKACSDSFHPPLDQKLDLREYANKIFSRSVTFEAWAGALLIGLLAAYFNDLEARSGFVTNVSLLQEYEGSGIASELMDMCIRYARQNKFRELKLEVGKSNRSAIRLYSKFGFLQYETRDETLSMRLTGY